MSRLSLDGSSWQHEAACALCNKTFGMLTRQHHCRSCGNSVCSSCSNFVATSPDMYTYPDGQIIEKKLRICTLCLETGKSPVPSASPQHSPRSHDSRSPRMSAPVGYPPASRGRCSSQPTSQLVSRDTEVWEAALDALELKRCAQAQQFEAVAQRRQLRLQRIVLRQLARQMRGRVLRDAVHTWRVQKWAAKVRVPKKVLVACYKQVHLLRHNFNQLHTDTSELLSRHSRDSIDAKIEQMTKAGARLSLNSQKQLAEQLLPMPSLQGAASMQHATPQSPATPRAAHVLPNNSEVVNSPTTCRACVIQ